MAFYSENVLCCHPQCRGFPGVQRQVNLNDNSGLFIDHFQLSAQEAAKVQAREEIAKISSLFEAPIRLRYIRAGNSDYIVITALRMDCT